MVAVAVLVDFLFLLLKLCVYVSVCVVSLLAAPSLWNRCFSNQLDFSIHLIILKIVYFNFVIGILTLFFQLSKTLYGFVFTFFFIHKKTIRTIWWIKLEIAKMMIFNSLYLPLSDCVCVCVSLTLGVYGDVCVYCWCGVFVGRRVSGWWARY